MWKVYKHTTPSGKTYIGVTHLKPAHRWNNGKGYSQNTHFWRAICKYGWNNIKHEILADGLTRQEAEKIEHFFIMFYQSYDRKHGYNIALGGHLQSEESRRKISETRKERGYTSWTKGKHLSKETRDKISKSRKGKKIGPLPKEWRMAISRAKQGSKNPNYGKGKTEQLKKAIEKNKRPVAMIDGEKRIAFESCADAARITGICAANINRVCNGKRETAGGFRWEFT